LEGKINKENSIKMLTLICNPKKMLVSVLKT